MSRSKTKRSSSDFDQIDKLKHENQKLKRQISQLRKQIARLDLSRYTNIKELVDKYEHEDQEEKKKEHKDQIKKLWECFQCRSDHLRMVTFERKDGVFYFRKCNSCNHRTKLKRLTSDTKEGPLSSDDMPLVKSSNEIQEL